MTLIVTTPAATTALTTVEAVMEQLEITDDIQTTRIQTEIDRASALICSYLGVQEADDGTVTLGRETLIETIEPEQPGRVLYPSRRPLVSVTSITEGGIAVDAADYTVSYGKITRVQSSTVLNYWWTSWANLQVAITYVAGWLLPGDADRNLPLEIEAACIELVKAGRFNRLRDPALRSETTQGIDSHTLFDRSRVSTVISPEIAATIDRYRAVYV